VVVLEQLLLVEIKAATRYFQPSPQQAADTVELRAGRTGRPVVLVVVAFILPAFLAQEIRQRKAQVKEIMAQMVAERMLERVAVEAVRAHQERLAGHLLLETEEQERHQALLVRPSPERVVVVVRPTIVV
jgi:hypothetical protein